MHCEKRLPLRAAAFFISLRLRTVVDARVRVIGEAARCAMRCAIEQFRRVAIREPPLTRHRAGGFTWCGAAAIVKLLPESSGFTARLRITTNSTHGALGVSEQHIPSQEEA